MRILILSTILFQKVTRAATNIDTCKDIFKDLGENFEGAKDCKRVCACKGGKEIVGRQTKEVDLIAFVIPGYNVATTCENHVME